MQVMDKIDAIKLTTNYLKRIRKNNINFSEAWIFGSYAKGFQHENSDIDVAIVFGNNEKITFNTEVQLMIIRDGEETLIEPHAFTKEEFETNIPIINQIKSSGERVII